uniref:PxKF domain-containing protein n=1 Tax=Streptomyces sp. NBC_00003 TaxID=2903608 RepID=A0AAU2UXA3_9ACTN
MSQLRTTAHPVGRGRRPWRARLTALFAGAVLVSGGLFALAAPAQADADLQLTGSAASVQANTSYTYTITMPQVSDVFVPSFSVTADLSGSAASFTAWSMANNTTDTCTLTGTHAACTVVPGHLTAADSVITLTVLPTAAGTANATATATYFGGTWGTDSTSTTITPAGPVYTFTGFFQPVDNPPTVNTMKAGRAVPVKFSLGGDQGLNIFATGYPVSQGVTCDTGAPTAPVEETTGAGGSSLTYDAASGTYTYVWKTDSAWKDTCRTFDLKLADGSDHNANFKFS